MAKMRRCFYKLMLSKVKSWQFPKIKQRRKTETICNKIKMKYRLTKEEMYGKLYK